MGVNVSQDLAVQSFCFRGCQTNEEVAEKVKEIGLTKIEVCQKHIKFADESTHAAGLAAYKAAGVDIVSIGVQSFNNDVETEEKFFKFAKMAGLKYIAANFSLESGPDCWKAADALAEKYDVKLAIHNHGSKHWLGTVQALKWVMNQTSDRIGLCLDTAWALHSREDPVKMVSQFGKRLYGVHFKDFTFDRAGAHEDVVIGTGNLKLKDLCNAMKDVDFNGYAALEYEGDVNNPVPKLKECVEAIRSTW